MTDDKQSLEVIYDRLLAAATLYLLAIASWCTRLLKPDFSGSHKTGYETGLHCTCLNTAVPIYNIWMVGGDG